VNHPPVAPKQPGLGPSAAPFCAGLLATLAAACATAPAPTSAPAATSASTKGLDLSESDAVRAALTLPPSHEGRREELVAAVVRAHGYVQRFAAAEGWTEQAKVRNFDRVEIFATQQGMWTFVLGLFDMDPNTPMMGKGPVAAPDGRVLAAVIPEIYAEVEPQYAKLEDAYSQLLAHEMMHRLHVVILEGDEDAMGPRWFFEGFAVVGSGQTIDDGLTFANPAEALAAAHDSKSPNAYRRYGAAVRFFAQKIPMKALVANASRKDLDVWLEAQSAR